MRHLLVIAACLSVSGCDAFYTPRFDIREMQAWRLCPTPTGKVEAHLPTDANHCGGCGNACGDGVTCVEGECNYSTRIHCGGSGRTCVGFEGGVDVDCVFVGDADFDPALGPVVRGYACAPVASLPMEPVEAPITPPIVEPVDLVVGDPPLEPDWILVPGRSTNCRDRVDRSCYFTEVEVRDVCGESCTAHIEHDFELMTTEMSRAMYRDLVLQCACEGSEPPLCVELCLDDAEAEARPITGLSWCHAYEACQAVGGRLPTLIERARVEAMVDVDRGLFTRPDVCGEWVAEVGTAPMVAECYDLPETLELDRVDGLEGAVPIGTEVLPMARYFFHLFGNADEWLADPLDGATCAQITSSQPWGIPDDVDVSVGPRLSRGRSLFSPAGETGDRTIALDPGAQAAELGVRCARTSVDTAPTPTPYSATVPARDYARCRTATAGDRSVRDAVGDRVYQARRTCVDWRVTPTGGVGAAIEDLLAQALAGDLTGLARHPVTYEGRPVEVGQARFAVDEQWWIDEPASAPGESMTIGLPAPTLTVVWDGEYNDFGPACSTYMEVDTPSSRTDGRQVIGQLLRIDEHALSQIVGPGRQAEVRRFASQHLDCAEGTDGACDAWHLPIVVEFRRLEAVDRANLCGAPGD